MTNKVYRTAMGKEIDLGALMLQNENVRAVGNMKVNARGDALNSGNKVIEKKTSQVNRQYKKQTNVSAAPVTGSKKKVSPQKTLKKQGTVKVPAHAASVDMLVNTEAPKAEIRSGLAAALAKAKSIKQESEKTTRHVEQEKQGVIKI